MAFRCPQCACVSPLSEADVGAAGCMVRCEQCGTRWLARRFEEDPYQRPVLQRVIPALPEISDAVVIEHIGPGFTRLPPHRREQPAARRRTPRDRRALKIMGTVFGALVAIVLLRSPIVAALPQPPGSLPADVALLEFQSVRSETVHLRGNSTLFVEGEIVNRSGSDVALPAIRITLRSSAGEAVTSWLVEPAVAGLAAGRSIGFRSALASPPGEATQVTLNLAAREGT